MARVGLKEQTFLGSTEKKSWPSGQNERVFARLRPVFVVSKVSRSGQPWSAPAWRLFPGNIQNKATLPWQRRPIDLQSKTGCLAPKPFFSFSTTPKIVNYTPQRHSLEGQTKVPPKRNSMPEFWTWPTDYNKTTPLSQGSKKTAPSPPPPPPAPTCTRTHAANVHPHTHTPFQYDTHVTYTCKYKYRPERMLYRNFKFLRSDHQTVNCLLSACEKLKVTVKDPFRSLFVTYSPATG